MKKFEFKLETVLKMRIRQEEQRQKQLREAEQFRDEAMRRLTLRQNEIEEVIKYYQQSTVGQFDLMIVNDYDNYLAWLVKMLDLDTRRLERCEEQVKEARRLLIQASKEKKIVEKLKENAYRRHQADELHEEINFLDELGANRAARQEIIG